MLRFTRTLPGRYGATSKAGYHYGVFTFCDCGRSGCHRWAVVVHDPEEFEVARHEGFRTMADAKAFAEWLDRTGPE